MNRLITVPDQERSKIQNLMSKTAMLSYADDYMLWLQLGVQASSYHGISFGTLSVELQKFIVYRTQILNETMSDLFRENNPESSIDDFTDTEQVERSTAVLKPALKNVRSLLKTYMKNECGLSIAFNLGYQDLLGLMPFVQATHGKEWRPYGWSPVFYDNILRYFLDEDLRQARRYAQIASNKIVRHLKMAYDDDKEKIRGVEALTCYVQAYRQILRKGKGNLSPTTGSFTFTPHDVNFEIHLRFLWKQFNDYYTSRQGKVSSERAHERGSQTVSDALLRFWNIYTRPFAPMRKGGQQRRHVARKDYSLF